MSKRFAHNLRCGATALPDGRTSFRLWAPKQQAVSLVLQDGPTVAMTAAAGGWFEITASCAAGSRYRYQLADGMLVPDPASRAQAADVHDPSVVIDPHAYTWRNTDWQGRPWRETVLYELHVGILGGFRGVAKELPRLAALGVTAVELMPINDFPGRRNWGYDGVLPYAPDAAYGTPDDLKSLVDAVHDHGLMIFLDVVYNHFGPDGNYLSLYAPTFFRQDRHTPWGAAIDFRVPEVRRFFTDNVLYWLMEYRFDGLRFDAVHAIEEQDWVDEMAATVRATVEPGRHVHLVLEHHNDVSHLDKDIDAQWNDDGHNVLHVLLTGETAGYYRDYADRPAEKLARCLAEGFVYQGEHSTYLNAPRGMPSAHLSPLAYVLFLQNHDQIGNRAFGERLTTLSDPARLEAAIALLMLAPQIPMLFMGEEQASRTPFLFFTDYHADLADAVREGRRNEFTHFPAFADLARRERIPDPNSLRTFEASVPHADPELGQWREALYRQLIEIRQSEIVPRLDGARALEARALNAHSVVARWRLGDGAVLTLACNLGTERSDTGALVGRTLFAVGKGAAASAQSGSLPRFSTYVCLDTGRAADE
jgi:maltooligosyltrehalose trehalohydrolase